MSDDSSSGRALGRQCVSLARTPVPAFGSAGLEVSGVLWVVGVGGPADFDMAFDSGAGGFIQGEYAAMALFLGKPDAEEPVFARR